MSASVSPTVFGITAPLSLRVCNQVGCGSLRYYRLHADSVGQIGQAYGLLLGIMRYFWTSPDYAYSRIYFVGVFNRWEGLAICTRFVTTKLGRFPVYVITVFLF